MQTYFALVGIVLLVAFSALVAFLVMHERNGGGQVDERKGGGQVDERKEGKPPRVLIATWYDDKGSSYGDTTFRMNSSYGSLHGIDVIRSTTPRTDRSPSWQRVPLLQQLLPVYDYVIWCDADAVFKPRAPDVRALLKAHSYPDVVLSRDVDGSENFGLHAESLSESRRKQCNLNAGIVMIKNSDAGRELLRLWFHPDSFEKYQDDQSILRSIYMSYLDGDLPELGAVVALPYGDLQYFVSPTAHEDPLAETCSSTPYVYHAAGDHKGRVPKLQDMEQLSKRCPPAASTERIF